MFLSQIGCCVCTVRKTQFCASEKCFHITSDTEEHISIILPCIIRLWEALDFETRSNAQTSPCANLCSLIGCLLVGWVLGSVLQGHRYDCCGLLGGTWWQLCCTFCSEPRWRVRQNPHTSDTHTTRG